MTTKTGPTDLAASLTVAQRESEEATALERQAAEARARAERAEALARAQQEAAKRAWAESVMASYDERRRKAHEALTAADRVLQESINEPETTLSAWLDREEARAGLYAVELRREKAAGILGHGVRAAKLPRPDLAADLATLLNGWARERLAATKEGVNASLAAAVSGKEVSHAK